MNLDYIREFCALADLRKFSEAAEVSFISQSALSKHIKALEAELGAPLFYRTAHCVILTEFGEAFLPYAKEFGETHLKCENNLLFKVNNKHKLLNIGMSPLISVDYLFQNIPSGALQNLGFSLEVREAPEQHLRKLLTTGSCSLIVCTSKQPGDEDAFIVQDFCNDTFCLVSAPDMQITAKNAASIPYVQVGPESYYGQIFNKIRHPDFIAPNICCAFDLVKQSNGFTICSKGQARQYLPDNLVIQELPTEFKLHYYLLYHQPNSLDTNAHLIDILRLLFPNKHEKT